MSGARAGQEADRVRQVPRAPRCVAAAILALVAWAPWGALARAGAPAPARAEAFGIDLPAPDASAGPADDPAALARAGVRWVRITADWSRLEPAPGRYVWADLDRQVREARSAGERVVAVLRNTPRWAAPEPDAPPLVWRHQPPRRTADWAAFVGAAAARYCGRVAAWQVEPSLDLPVYRGTSEDYREMLHAAREAVRRADPSARLVAASPAGIDLPFVKAMLARAGGDFDAIVLSPRGRTPEDVLEALAVLRARVLAGARHEVWLSAEPEWDPSGRLAVAALAGGVSREFWSHLAPSLAAAVRLLGAAHFVGPLARGPGVYALVFTDGTAPVAVVWTAGAPRPVPLATAGSPAAVGPAGGAVPAGPEGTVPAGPEPVFVSNPAPSVVEEAQDAARRGPAGAPRDPGHDFSQAESVSARLGAVNVEHGLYNQRLRDRPAGGVVPVVVDGVEAVRTDQPRDAVYVYFDVDHSYAYFVDGRYDLLITVEVHRARAPRQVGFDLLYDSMSGYRFTPWQWVEAGEGWAAYTVRITDADFSSTWGWDFAVNGAGDTREDLIVRAVTVRKVPAGAAR